MKQHIPNILTYARLVLCLIMFAAFAPMASLGLGNYIPFSPRILTAVILVSFVVAAVTDFLDGYLARKWNVVSMTGAILDPIADKVLVCGAIIGLCTITQSPHILIAGGVILFREFSVSALREVLAPKGIKLPVTFLAKTKTTLQLVALAFLMVALFRPFWSADVTLDTSQWLTGAYILFYIAAAITVWTGIEYGLAARKALASR
jgi:CDP-diacylglycerol--glycerol-3-phosphate 3-phosphatidyltransferase